MADKSKSIKEATDKELDELLIRLRKESEAMRVIRDMKRMSMKSSPYTSYEDRENEMAVSTEQPVESLYHFGVLGMKWGVRRSPAQLARAKGKSPNDDDEPKSEDERRKRTLSRKRTSQMSNAELKELTTRLQLEKQYKDLTKVEKSKGRKMVEEILTNSAKTALTEYTTKYFKDTLAKALDEKNGDAAKAAAKAASQAIKDTKK